jgi:predicted amidohydrolase YtcJ
MCVIDTTSGSHAYAICTAPGSIYTVDEEDSTTDCMLIENGKILAIGNTGMPHFTSLVCLI